MKKRIYLILFLLTLYIPNYSQTLSPLLSESSPIESIYKDKNFSIKKDSLLLSFSLTLSSRKFKKNSSLHIIPCYRIGNQEIKFPEILLNGVRRESYYRRETGLMSHEDYINNHPYLHKVYKGEKIVLNYRYAMFLPYLNLSEGDLYVCQYLEDCCAIKLLSLERFSISVNPQNFSSSAITRIKEISESNVTFFTPLKEKVKQRREHLILHINYKSNRSEVLPYYKNNAYELSKVDKLLRLLESNPQTYKINNAFIYGYASPESDYAHNLQLSESRANKFKSYLQNQYDLKNLNKITSVGKGEDWEGLTSLINNLSSTVFPYKTKVLSIIENVGIFSGREKRLMEIAVGTPYRYMLKNLFPRLRRIEMNIDYTVKDFNDDESDMLILVRPQDLSLFEMYSVARTHSLKIDTLSARKNYGKLYDLAVKYFSQDVIANLNASSAALIRGDLNMAKSYLDKVKDEPRSYNNYGVYYWLLGDKLKAEEFFIKALNVPLIKKQAKHNLELLNNQ